MTDNIKNKTQYSIGIDIGGTKMSAVLFDIEKKEIISDYKLATPADDKDKFLVMLYALIDPLIEKAKQQKFKVGHIGIGVAGMMDQPTGDNLEGKILKCPNLEILNGISLGKIIFDKYKIPTSVDNDANCFLRAEMIIGAAKNAANAVGITLGTGIGGSFSIDNNIYQGVHGSAGEIGHIIVDVVEGLPHTLEEIYHNLTQANPKGLAEEAYEGDKLATKVYEELGHLIGIALANVVNLIDPEVIVVGGGVMQSADLFMAELRNSLKEEIISPKLKKIKVLESKVENAGAVGAALLSE